MMNFCAYGAKATLVILFVRQLSNKRFQALCRYESAIVTEKNAVAATYVDIAHGDTRHDCRYVASYLRSGEIVGCNK